MDKALFLRIRPKQLADYMLTLVGDVWKKSVRLVVLIVGITLLLVGIAMIVLPGPALVVIPASLALLGTEFVWARRFLKAVQARIPGMHKGIFRRNSKKP